MTRTAWSLVAACLVGCDFTLIGPSEDGDSPVDTAPPTETGTSAGACADVWAESVESQLVEGDTTKADNARRPSCRGPTGVDDGPEVLVGFTAPTGGTWVFDLVEPRGTNFDTVIAVLGGCNGPELGCNDDADSTRQSRVAVGLAAGETVLVHVDGFQETDFGPFALSIELAGS